MNREFQTMRIHVAGRWSADEMGQFLLNTRDLYNLAFVLELIREDLTSLERYYEEFFPFPIRPSRRPLLWRRLMQFGYISAPPLLPNVDFEDSAALRKLLEPDEQLQVRRIEYASPGFKDLAGVGEVIGHLKEFLLRLIELAVTSRQRKLENEERELNNQRLRLENARLFVQVGREVGLSEHEIRRLAGFVDTKQESIIRLVEDGKITAVSGPVESE